MVDFKALAAPFDPREVYWRVGSTDKKKQEREKNDPKAPATKGVALAYIDARVVMERLDAVCGPGLWQASYPHAGQKTVCSIGIWCGPELGWVYKANGAGDSDIEAEKGALSDAYKRAGVLWGIGRYLYDIDSPWVELDKFGKITTPERKRLDQILRQHTQAILNPPGGVGGAASRALDSAKDDIAQMANERKAIELLSNTALLAIGTAANRTELKAWWGENKGGLREKLPENDFAAILGAVEARRDDLPAIEGAS